MMMKLIIALAGMGLGMAPALAQAPVTPAPAPAPTSAPVPAKPLPRVVLTTALGPIVVELDTVHAPVTSANFLAYVDAKRFDGTTFYRAMKFGEGGLVQGGTRNDPKRNRPPIAHEPTTATGLSHVDGAISMARNAPGTAQGDFFIIVGNDLTGLDARPSMPGDNLGFAVFGRVVEGMDLARQVLAAPTSQEGEGALKGQMIAAPVKVTSVRRAP